MPSALKIQGLPKKIAKQNFWGKRRRRGKVTFCYSKTFRGKREPPRFGTKRSWLTRLRRLLIIAKAGRKILHTGLFNEMQSLWHMQLHNVIYTILIYFLNLQSTLRCINMPYHAVLWHPRVHYSARRFYGRQVCRRARRAA